MARFRRPPNNHASPNAVFRSDAFSRDRDTSAQLAEVAVLPVGRHSRLCPRRWPSERCLRLCVPISRTSSSISTSAGARDLTTFDQPVRIVDIDDESIARIGRWPWPRETMASLVEVLAKANVAAIGFDVLFSEKDQPSEDQKACARRPFTARTRRRAARSGPTAMSPSPTRSPAGRSFLARSSPRPRTPPKPGSSRKGLFVHRRDPDLAPRPPERRAPADPGAGGRRERTGLS